MIKKECMGQLILFNKPYGVLSQFTDEGNRETLANYISIKHVYAAGRLDKDSEGLLLLTSDGSLQDKISHPRKKLAKHYWVQVEGEVGEEAIKILRKGVALKDGITKPAEIFVIDEPKNLWQRTPPVRFRKTVPTQWLEIIIHEGKNRQVRRMTAAVGHPTLRLIRHRIGEWYLGTLDSGESRILSGDISL
ncbi:MAG: pseudouridine synthase [Gammaproteobacteria bacterium]|nr:pseudouridine synthase [Gammaproteobacteria bacterium]